MKGKAYANKKSKSLRPIGDSYDTPKSLVWELLKREELKKVWEPACGNMAITEVLTEKGICNAATDIKTGEDFFEIAQRAPVGCECILTNPPFSLWDEFVEEAKYYNPEKIIMLGKTNFLGTYKRGAKGLWNNLKHVYIFNRMIDYRTPKRDDGLFHVGALVTGWFVWEKDYVGMPTFSQIDVQKYAKLGQYKENL